jgi:hypothetical protein
VLVVSNPLGILATQHGFQTVEAIRGFFEAQGYKIEVSWHGGDPTAPKKCDLEYWQIKDAQGVLMFVGETGRTRANVEDARSVSHMKPRCCLGSEGPIH